MRKDKYSTAEILEGIRKGSDTILRFIYDAYYESVENMVLKKNGSKELAKDIFQEALVSVFKMVQAEEFSIKQSSFFTFYYALCRNTLYMHYRSTKKDVLFKADEVNDYNINYSNDVDTLIIEGLKERLFYKYFKMISDKCRDILKLVMKGHTAAVIAKMLHFKSDVYVRKRKKVCLDTLVEMINNDPISKELL